jgi:hypothetical protein
MAKHGAKLLIRFLGPHKKLLDQFQVMRQKSPSGALRKAITELFADRL